MRNQGRFRQTVTVVTTASKTARALPAVARTGRNAERSARGGRKDESQSGASCGSPR
jgi:hypothetical protein